MDDLSATLVRLLACTLPGAFAPGLTMAPPPDITRTLLDELIEPAAVDAVADALGDLASGRSDLVSSLGRAMPLLDALDAAPQLRAILAARLHAADRALGLARCMSVALMGGLGRAEMRLAEAELFTLFETLTLPVGSGEPALVIVGCVPPSRERVSISLGRRTPLDRVQLAYDAGSPFPLLTLSTASRGEEVSWLPSRTAWRQEPELDLIIQNSVGSRDLGQISTALAEPPWNHTATQLNLSIPRLEGHILVVTTISDTAGKPLAHAVRVFRTV